MVYLKVLLFLLASLPPNSLAEDVVRSGPRKGKVVLSQLADVKEWKKLIKSKTNVLILLGNGKGSFLADDILGLVKEAGEVMRGLGTIATVDCSLSGDAKKLCKKVKATPSPGQYVMKHYHNGEFNKDYDRAPKLSSIVNFMKDPVGDLPWEEDETAQDVVHLPDLQALQKLLKKESKSKGVMVMFYAPWCGYCKKIKKPFSQAAQELGEDGILAAMDVNRPENVVVRQKFNITGFPTLIYFRNGQMKLHYEGETKKEDLVLFMKDPSAQKVEKPKEEEWGDDPNSEVVHLTADTFDEFIKSHPSTLVMFYAPWCGHCKRMKNEYEAAAQNLKKMKIGGVLAALDATKETSIGNRFDVKGYPTVKYFKDGELAFDVGNLRQESAIIDFMKEPKEPLPPPVEKAWSEEESHVIHLNEDNFKSTLRKKKRALVMFYAPWCGHCKTAKPLINSAAEQLKDDPRVMYGAVDCTVEKSLCETYKVTGFPTFKVFQYFNKEEVLNFEGERTESGFLNELKPGSGGTPVTKELPQEDHWSQHPGHEKVHILTDETIDSFFQSHQNVLVMFYAPWCGHCKQSIPSYIGGAQELEKDGIQGSFASMDCTKFQQICQKYKVSGYPTFQFFNNGKFSSDYNEGRTATDFVQFMKQKAKSHQEL